MSFLSFGFFFYMPQNDTGVIVTPIRNTLVAIIETTLSESGQKRIEVRFFNFV